MAKKKSFVLRVNPEIMEYRQKAGTSGCDWKHSDKYTENDKLTYYLDNTLIDNELHV